MPEENAQPTDGSLQNVLAVVDYLSAQGWKVKKSAVYNHRKEGKLRLQPDGSFRIADVERYAAAYLRRKDGSESGKLDKLQQEKLIAEIDKTKAQARHWTMKAETFSGAYVPKELFEAELARRAAIFRNDLETFARAETGGIVSLAAGDAGKIPDVIDWILGRVEAFLARYSEEREFKVPLPPPDSDARTEDDEDEEDQ